MESVVFDSYRILTKEVALGLSQDNIKEIKFIIRGAGVGKRVLEKTTTGTDLVQLLEEKFLLSAENVEPLSKFLQSVGRNDLDKNVQQYVESAISRNLSNHGYYGLHGMYVTANYEETHEYQLLCEHMSRNNSVILKGPPGIWKSQHAFRYAHNFSETRKQDQKSLIWRVECNTELNIYTSLSTLMNFLKIQCLNSENHMKHSIKMMLSRALEVLDSEIYKDTQHLFILLGFVSPQNDLIEMFLRQLSEYGNISIIVTTSQSLSNDFDKFVIEFQGMTEKEAVRFLNADDSSMEKAKELARRLSYFPDGLVFARTYLQTTKISINTYIERLENITSTDSASNYMKKACEILICEAEDSMTDEEKKVFHLMPYLNTDNIPIFVLKSLLPNTLSRKHKGDLINTFIRTLNKYSLISRITGLDEHRVIAAHRFTFMIVKSSTRIERKNHLQELLNFFMYYIDLDARLLEVIHRNVLLLDHAERFLIHFVDCSLYPETKAKLCYIYCAIGITYRLYGNTELSANTYLQKAKHTMHETFLSSHQHYLPSDRTINQYTTLDEYLNGSDALQEHCQSIFKILIEKGKHISEAFVDEFVRNKYRNSRSISLLCEYGKIPIEDVHTNQLNSEVVGLLQSKNLIMEGEYISTTFLVELMIRILYNSSKNNWLMEISKDSFTTPERGKLRKHLSSTHFPVTPDSLIEHQMAHCLTKSLQKHLSNLPKNDTMESSENTIRSFCPVFSPVTHRSGILYMLRSFSDPDRLSPLLNEAIKLLDSLDFNTDGTGFTEFGVVKRIGDSSPFHSVMIERIKMECYEKMFKLECPDQGLHNEDEIVERTGTTGVITSFTGVDLEAAYIPVNRLPLENEHLLKALSIAKHLEEKIDELTSWKALSGIHLKIAKVFKHTNTEENIIKAKHHYKKAYYREYESNNTRLTRFHLKAIVHYSECCLQFPVEKDLKKAKTLALAMKYRFRLDETGTLFDEVIEDMDKCLNKLSQNQHPDRTLNTKEKPKVDTKSTQTDTLTNEKNWLLKELKRRRDRLIQNQSTLLEHYENLKCDMETVNREIHSVEEEITNIEERPDIEPYSS